MSEQSLYKYILALAYQLEWPGARFISPASQKIYEQGLDLLQSYRGNPDVLLDALKVFQATESLPYALAGFAYTLDLASYQSRDDYEEEGLKEASRWLKQAQTIVAERPEIDFIEAVLAIDSKNYPQARAALGRLATLPGAQNNYFVSCAELYYWDSQKDLKRVYELYKQARPLALAHSKEREINLLRLLSMALFSNKRYGKFLRLSKRIGRLTPGDPWLWHNMSIACMNLFDYPRAIKYNRKALSLMEFEAARSVEGMLEKYHGWYGYLLRYAYGKKK